jgi:hypothetical protein
VYPRVNVKGKLGEKLTGPVFKNCLNISKLQLLTLGGDR